MKYCSNDDQMGVPDETLNAYLAVIVSQLLRPNNSVQICLHKFLDD